MTDRERDIYVYALRYSLGRKTFAFSTVSGEIIAKHRHFKQWQLRQMAEDIRWSAEFNKELQVWERREYREVAERLERFAEEVENVTKNRTGN